MAKKHTVADLELLFTANTTEIESAEKQVLAIGKKVESNPVKIDGDAKPVLEDMDRVEKAAKKLVSERAVVKLDADISRAEKNLERAVDKLEDLHVRAEGGLDVTADVKRAEASIQRLERQLDGLRSARNAVDVEVNEEPAESGLKRFLALFKRKTDEAGAEGGRSLSQGLDSATRGAGEKVGAVVGGDIEKTLIDALSAIPIAGGIILAGVAIGKAVVGGIQDGLAVEKRTDKLQALTGISEADALRIGRAAGEAYANNFGESIESNMDATRLALQFRIIDPAATTRDAQLVVQGLTGISDVLGEDVLPTARAVTTMLSSGLARSSKEAFDILAAGVRNGVNLGEDLLDTFNEYSSVFASLGISGPEALGLLNQGLVAGARNSDVVADGLLELRNLTTSLSDDTRTAFDSMGLSADDLAAKIAAGGPAAREGLEQILDGLRDIEDPLERNNAGIAIFGTKWEDTAGALGNLNLSNAVAQLNGVEGSAQRMFDTLSGNDASKIEQAQRNIEVAADGIKGALASAFSEPLGDFADWVSQNRGPVLQFFSDLINSAFDFGVSATESFGAFVSGPLAETVDGIAGIVDFFNGAEGRPKELDDLAESMRGFDDSTEDAVDKLEQMRSQFNGFADGQIALGYVNDAALRTAEAVGQVGLNADGTRISIEGLDTANLRASESGKDLDDQLQASASSLEEQYLAALVAGESQENLTDRYNATRDALMGQLTAMGLSEDQAQSLIDTVLKTPEKAYTIYSSNASAESDVVDKLNQKIVQLPDGNFIITSDTSPAQRALDDFLARNSTKQVNIATSWSGGLARASGGPIFGPGGPRDDLVPVMASNGEHMLTADEVNAAGGHGEIYRLRRALRNGTLRLAGGGPVAVPSSTWAMPSFSAGTSSQAAAPVIQVAAPSLDGMAITGRLQLDPDGFATLIDGRIRANGEQLARGIRSRRRSDG